MKNKNLKSNTNILKKISFLIVIFSFSFLVFSLSKIPVLAQSLLPLTVAPARQEIKINPGDKTALNVRFYNLSDSPVSGLIKVANFVVQNKDGSPHIIEETVQSSPRFSASSWINLPFNRINIAANDKVSLQAKITVPANARPGGRYVAIYFQPTTAIPKPIGAPEEGESVITARLASLFYIRVAGPITEKALITRLFTPVFHEYGPINLESEILNRGDYHIRPKGVLTLSNVFGGAVDQNTLKEQNIFPDVSRTYKNSLGQKWMFGRYKINLAVSYGSQGKALERFIYVWVFPWRVATAVILAIIIISYLLYHFYKVTRSRQTELEKEMGKEQEEIEKLKTELKKRHE